MQHVEFRLDWFSRRMMVLKRENFGNKDTLKKRGDLRQNGEVNLMGVLMAHFLQKVGRQNVWVQIRIRG